MNRTDSSHSAHSMSVNEDGLIQLSRSPENTKRVKAVQDKFVNSQSLLRPGRALVGEGILMKVCRKKPKQRAFFLFNDILVYGRVVMNGRKYSHQKILLLSETRISDNSNPEENPYSWLICSPKKSFIVRANSDRERQEWIAHLDRCIRAATSIKLDERHGSGAVAACWVPDDKATTCMHCNTLKFSTYNRKHHCRNCGFIVCEGCSKKRFLLEHLSSKPVRVCDSCYKKLNENNVNQTRQLSRDSSDSDGDETNSQYSATPTTFYQNIENV